MNTPISIKTADIALFYGMHPTVSIIRCFILYEQILDDYIT